MLRSSLAAVCLALPQQDGDPVVHRSCDPANPDAARVAYEVFTISGKP